MKKYLTICLTVALALAMSLMSCNKKDDTPTTSNDYDVYTTTSTLVSAFSLKANTKIMAHLDSVKFTIDQDRGVIYNADSLPRGTRINALLVDLTCASSVASKEFIIKNGQLLGDTTITYNTSKSDSIDFTGDVTLRITSGDRLHVRDYKVKVNVHKQDVDTIMWNLSGRRDLPNLESNLIASKTVTQGEKFLCLIDDNGNYILGQSEDPHTAEWSRTELSLPFIPQVNSFVATDNELFMLDINGQLFKSDDMGAHWTDCGLAWHSLIGTYENRVLGVVQEGGDFYHVEFADGNAEMGAKVPVNFPVEGMSPMVMASNEWTSMQQAMMMGGVRSDGNYINLVWGYDGHNWAPINNDDILPEMRDAVLFPYYTFVKRSTGATYDKRVTWMVMGGRLSDGTLNTTSYVSRNQCINWSVGELSIQMPDHMPAFYGAQVYAYVRTCNASTLMSYNPGHVTPATGWECPFIYLFGGYGSNGLPLNSVWEGVLSGLTFKPVF